MHDPVAVALKAGAFGVGLLAASALPRPQRAGRPLDQVLGLPRLALLAQHRRAQREPRSGVTVGANQTVTGMPGHRLGPGDRTWW